MAKLRKLIACETVASSGGKCFKKLKRGQINPEAGLYDANDNLVASWDTLLATYGMDEKWEYETPGINYDGSPVRVLNDNSDLESGTKFVIDNSIKVIGTACFRGCTRLKSIDIPESVKSIWNGAFSGCTSLESIVIPDNMEDIGDGVFTGCTNLKSVTVGSGDSRIGSMQFYNCTSLTSVTIPASVTTIRNGAFANCTSLTDVYYRGTEKQWAAITIEGVNECLTNATIHYNSQ